MSILKAIWTSDHLEAKKCSSNESSSTVLDFEDEEIRVSIGSVGAHGCRRKLATFELKFAHIQINAGADLLQAWKNLPADERRSFVYKLVLSHMTPEIFKDLLVEQFKDGEVFGRNSLRMDLKKLLSMEC